MASNNQRDFSSEASRIRRAIIRRLVWSAIIAVGVFVLALLLFYLTPVLPNGPRHLDWALLEGFISLLSLALVLGGSIFALREYINNEIQQEKDEIQRQKDEAKVAFDVYQVIFDRLMNPEDIAARRWIIQHIPVLQPDEDQEAWVKAVRGKIQAWPEDWQGETSPGQIYVKRVLNTLDFVGFVAENYWGRWHDELVQWMSSPITKVWERIGPYVEYEAIERKEPDFYQAARMLSEYCLEWRREHRPVSKIIDGAI
jgi:hypothetical protein